ncbi:hypothetical protein BDW02DRAFT_573443 [Decorospora gaudefroyi]|uniref:Velvet domain-containing protein n=1 Tax=Decorospora gaudefroyi TaxID=184978 RepID=A0A6A5K183_9PLEO|nr:hypothetical protein BDW02DRAFT_573443 [Decorospora gaudefroyi]
MSYPNYPPRMNPGGPVAVPRQHYLRRDDGREYELVVEQQPIRARMCGFGDKDRRPITPPPCIRLVVRDKRSGRELDFNDIDSTYHVLVVDLWNEQGTGAVNLVRHSSAAPTVSISSSTVTSFPPPPERAFVATGMPMYEHQQMGHQPMPPYGHGAVPQPYFGQAQPGGYVSYPSALISTAATSSNHTRNLIGMNAVNASRLNDLEGKPGFWFVLQDLSVRTEGTFRLKLRLFDISANNGTNATLQADGGPTQGKGPCLAHTLSDPFTVYSAKKFPGVIESTPLSKCFAQQGIKIPIRKDGPKLPNRAEYDADD